MGYYPRTTRAWLENRFRKKDDNGNYFAHMPIYGIGHPSGEGNHVARTCRFLRILRVLDGLELRDDSGSSRQSHKRGFKRATGASTMPTCCANF